MMTGGIIMKKTMLRAVSAMITAAMLAPFTANADTASTAEIPEGYTLIGECGFLEKHMHYYVHGNYSSFYVNSDGTGFIGVKGMQGQTTVFRLAEGVASDDIVSAVNALYPDGGLRGDSLNGGRTATENGVTWVSMELLKEDTARYCADFREKGLITECMILSEIQPSQEISTNGIGYYEETTYDRTAKQSVETEKLLKPVVESELPGYTLEHVSGHPVKLPAINRSYLVLVPPEGAALSDQIRAAQVIYEKTGVSIAAETEFMTASAAKVDVFNAVAGDANDDGSTTVADAVAILQSIANRDKYALSAQGEFNGDIYGNYDGITAGDALEIQKLDANGYLG